MSTEMNHSARLVDFTQFKLEKHVQEALQVAGTLAQDQPINARHALVAALIIQRTSSSAAFEMLSSLLPSDSLENVTAELEGDMALTAVPLNPALADAYDAAQESFRNEGTIWGRDYITFALLANDPTIRELADHASLGIERLRDEWYRFVTKNGSHRRREAWRVWWHEAGVPLPDERGLSSTGNTFLLTWNPSRTPAEGFAEVVLRVSREGAAVMSWSVGSHGVSTGDRVFLMRHNSTPGIVGVGQVVGQVEKGDHWDTNRPPDWEAFYAAVRWDVLNDFPLIPLDTLKEKTGEADVWTKHGSGLPIAKDVAVRLEALWEEALAQQRPSGSGTVTPIPCFTTDSTSPFRHHDCRMSERDSLDMKSQADVFAALIVARDAQLPLTIGLLGDWGVGKTSFLRLIQEQVDLLTGKGVSTRASSDSVSRTAQIEFNAWHYVDSNLWASLASHIFDSLSEQLRVEGEQIVDVHRRLRSEIRSSVRHKEEAEAAVRSAQEELKNADIALAQFQEERTRKASECNRMFLKRIWESALAIRLDANKPGADTLASLKTETEEITARLGIADAIGGVQDAQEAYVQLRELSRRGRGLSGAFLAMFTGQRVWPSAIAFLLLSAFVFFCPSLLKLINAHSTQWAEDVSRWLSPLTRLATIAGISIVWIREKLHAASSAMSYLERIQEEISRSQIDPSVLEEEKARQAKIKELDASVAAQQCRIEEATRQIDEAQAEIQRINAGGLVYDFLDGRARDSRYLDRLGLISVIRQDFESLEDLLTRWRQNGASSGSGAVSATTASQDTRPIDRIILYVDDLDRCPPERVVQVLEAVHLLLAFDLFVVVVAVDARWLERSLNEVYNAGTMMPDGSDFDRPMHRFSAHNYLEKIIQIPFSLPPMDEAGYRQLIGDLNRQSQAQSHQVTPRTDLSTDGQAELSSSIVEIPPSDPALADGAVSSESVMHPEESSYAGNESEREQNELKTARKRVEAVVLSKHEEQFMAALFPFIRTPRLAKRFLNVYRLLRIRAVMEQDISTFIDPVNGEFRAVLVLLAISIGYPNAATEIVQYMGSSNETSFTAWLEVQSRRHNDERSGFDEPSIRGEDPADLLDTLGDVRKGIDLVVETLARHEGPRFDDRLSAYTRWSRVVNRYSFHWQA